MMSNLFSMFDPCSIYELSLNWMSALIPLLLMPPIFWFFPNSMNLIIMNTMKALHNEFKIIINNHDNFNFNIIFINLLIFIMINNLMGLFPYIFTGTSHMTLNLSLALPLWLSLLMYGWMKKTNHMFSHLVPQGTPKALIPFMVCIETISNLIRPITLTVRLTANMIAGHLLLTLLGELGPKLSYIFLPFLLSIQLILLTLESAVSIIQAYVFSILITLYCSEI